MFRYLASSLALALLLAWPAAAQDSDNHDDNFDVRSSVGDLHVGKDADAQKAGFSLYPRARPKHEKDNDPLNLGILTEAFGIKLVVAKYESDDAPDKIVAYYRNKLKRYGKVLECHSRKDDDHFNIDNDKGDDKNGSKELKCEGENSGPVTELKVGTEDHGHFVSIEPGDKGKGSTFSLVYVYARGKQGDI
jgi:hypothetical protein